MQRNHRADAAPVIRDIPALAVVLARKLAAHQLNGLRIGRPYGEAHRSRVPIRHKRLVGAEPPTVGEIIALRLVGTREREDAVTVGRIGVVDLGGNAPEVLLRRRIDDHAPAERLADLGLIEHRGGAKSRAAVVGRTSPGLVPGKPRPIGKIV